MSNKRFEIGSEFSLDVADLPLAGDNLVMRLSHYHATYYSSGRNAIRAVLRNIRGRRALLPSYICQSVIRAFELEHCSVDFYQIHTDLSIDLDDFKNKLTADTDIVFFMNYFGNPQSDHTLSAIRKLCSETTMTIIEDTTQSILTNHLTIGDYGVASLRKWFALPDGGVAYSMNHAIHIGSDSGELAFSNARAAAMFLKGIYLNGGDDHNATYRMLFADAERWMDDDQEIRLISDFSKERLSRFDVGNAIKKRSANAAFVAKQINNPLVQPVIEVIDGDCCPFFYPLYVRDRDRFRAYLNRNKIYCPVHWPLEDERIVKFESAVYISQHLISIPIDQRYGESDMAYLCSVINEYQEDTREPVPYNA